MTHALSRLSLATLLLATSLAGCESGPIPDNRIKLMPSADGKRTVAVPPDCLNWHDNQPGQLENHPWSQHGCVTARNLAAQVERVEDLSAGREMGDANGVTAASAVARYLAGKTTPLINPTASEPATIVKMEDSRMGGGESK